MNNDNCVKWIVTVPNQYSNDPRAAKILCVVDIKTEQEFDVFDSILRKEHLRAFKEKSYKHWFIPKSVKNNPEVAALYKYPKAIALSTFKSMKYRKW
jgi:hypothetical protein